MEAVALEKAHLIGHSMGDYICLWLAAQQPEIVWRLVLVAPVGTLADRSLFGHLVPLLLTARYAAPSFLPVLAYDALRTGPVNLLRVARNLLSEDVREDLRFIEAPTLLIWGENDP